MNRLQASGPTRPPLLAGYGVEAMLDAAEAVADTHALVIGPFALDVLCGLIRRGCAAAAELPFAGAHPAERAEIVLVPHLRTLEDAGLAIVLARRALLPCGRIVLQVAEERLANPINRLLRTAGFSALRVQAHPDGAIVTADWPMFGLRREVSHA